jgi:hypothetical protein
MKQITKTQAVKDLAQMFGAKELKLGCGIDYKKAPCYFQDGTRYRFLIPMIAIPWQEAIQKAQQYFEEHKLKGSYACKFDIGRSLKTHTIFDLDLIKNL